VIPCHEEPVAERHRAADVERWGHRRQRVRERMRAQQLPVTGVHAVQVVQLHTDGALRLSAGTLYRSIQRLLEQGLLVETRDRPAPELDDERRRYYRITPFGIAVARAEARRLTELVRLARASGFAPGKA